MRIVGGAQGGHRLGGPRSTSTRPTSARVREALFAILGSRAPEQPAAVLDLFAGTGALGIEALSRGAAHALFVESSNRAAEQVRKNLAQLRLDSQAQVLVDDALRVVGRLAQQERRFDWIFVDPPYASPLGTQTLDALGSSELLSPGGLAIYEHSSRSLPAEQFGRLQLLDRRRYGDTGLSFYGEA